MDLLNLLIQFLMFILNKFNQNNSTTTTTTTTPPQLTSFSTQPSSSLKCPDGFVGKDCRIECGLRFREPNVKIVGGSYAVANSWPSQVFIKLEYEGKYDVGDGNLASARLKANCGGNLIDESHVLTAAHCFPKRVGFFYDGLYYEQDITLNENYPTYESMITVYLGMHNRSFAYASNPSKDALYPVVKANISRFTLHEAYDELESLQNDIALIRLAEPVALGKNIQPACLPLWTKSASGYPSANQSSFAVGWGTTSAGGSQPDLLKNTKLTVYENGVCDSVAPRMAKNHTTQICSGDLTGQTDTCQGDSGGPLFVLDTINEKEKYVLAGVVSYGAGCAVPDSPTIYTRLVAYLDWMDRNKQID